MSITAHSLEQRKWRATLWIAFISPYSALHVPHTQQFNYAKSSFTPSSSILVQHTSTVKHEVTQEEKKKKGEEMTDQRWWTRRWLLLFPTTSAAFCKRLFFLFCFLKAYTQTSSLTQAQPTSMHSYSAKTWLRCSCADIILWPLALPTLPFPMWSKV